MAPQESDTFPVNKLILQIAEERSETSGETLATLRVTNTASVPLAADWRIYFSLGLTPLESETRVIRTLIEGRYGYLSPGPQWSSLPAGETLVIPIENWLLNGMPFRARQGFHVTINGSEPQAPQVWPPALLPLDHLENDWIPGTSPAADTRPQNANNLFDRYASLATQTNSISDWTTTVIPTPHFADYKGRQITTPGLNLSGATGLRDVLGYCENTGGLSVSSSISGDLIDEGYQLLVDDEGIEIKGGSTTGVYYGAQTLRQLIQNAGDGYSIPTTRIDDRPDFSHRALFIDLARHFQPPEELRRIIRAMAAYKLNRLQLGISNDEGWRLEVPEIPELTQVGARRLFHADGPEGARGLYPAWGDDHEEQTAFLTRRDFISLLDFARLHHVEIILELNLPAHANALIRSINASGRFTLTDPQDTSVHRSAQGYTNNVVNVCIPDVYKLARELFSSFAQLYRDANVPFRRIHLGGDEVPEGSWLHSPACQQLLGAMQLWQPDWDASRPEDAAAITAACLDWYAENILSALEEVAPGTEAGFWHEMSPYITERNTGGTEGYRRVYLNSWTTEAGEKNIPEEILARRQHMVISNASYLYLDMPHGLHAEESGLPWAAYIDTDTLYHFHPLRSWQIPGHQRALVKGLQAQLWTETITSTALLHAHLFPRLLAVAERAWCSEPQPAQWQGFAASVGHRELAWLMGLSIQCRIPPPGARINDGSLEANVMFPGLEVHYTLDGTEPTLHSPVYQGSVPVNKAARIKIAAFCNGDHSRVVSL